MRIVPSHCAIKMWPPPGDLATCQQMHNLQPFGCKAFFQLITHVITSQLPKPVSVGLVYILDSMLLLPNTLFKAGCAAVMSIIMSIADAADSW